MVSLFLPRGIRNNNPGNIRLSKTMWQGQRLPPQFDPDFVEFIAPRYGLADRVMGQVPVFVPWHVAAWDALTPWVPAARPMRLVAAFGTAMVGALVTGGTLWVAARGDLVALITGLAGEGARTAATDAAGSLVVALFGPQVVTVIRQMGAWGLAAAAIGFAAASLATIVGLRHVATTTRARS